MPRSSDSCAPADARPHRLRLLLSSVLLAPILAACSPYIAPEPAPPATAAATPTTTAPTTSVFVPGDASAGVPALARHGMVVSASAIASDVGAQVLRDGGNAIDAAIATGFALAVTYPTAGNIGGGGFMVIRFADGRVTAFDFREKAPLAADSLMFVDSTGEYSYERHHSSHLAVGVPGTVAGFALAHERYGSQPWRRLVEPAAALATDGFAVPPGLAGSLAGVLDNMTPYPASVQKFSRDGTPYQEGELFRQPDLGRTLARIAADGHDGFYRGETARLLADEMRRGGGLITEQDLALYQAQERTPIRGTYRGYGVIGMPPPSSGGIAVVEMLNILEGFDLDALGHNTAPYLHHLTEAMRRAFRDRARYVADTDFVDVPIERLTSKQYAAELRRTIDPEHATPSSVEDITEDYESEHTTHFSVVDAAGNAVSVTYTLEQGYGSKITVPGAGFLLNNEMGDFNPRPGLTTADGLIGTPPNRVRPQQRMLSSMSPTSGSRQCPAHAPPVASRRAARGRSRYDQRAASAARGHGPHCRNPQRTGHRTLDRHSARRHHRRRARPTGYGRGRFRALNGVTAGVGAAPERRVWLGVSVGGGRNGGLQTGGAERRVWLGVGPPQNGGCG